MCAHTLKESHGRMNRRSKAGNDGMTIGIFTLRHSDEGGDVRQTGFVAVEIRNKKEG